MTETLKKYTVFHTDKITFVDDKSRTAILPIFKQGIFDLEDDRKFKMTELDIANLKEAFTQKRNPTPVLYEHGSGTMGGKAAGKVLSLQNKEGNILAHSNLNQKPYLEIKDGEWFGCSAGFMASVDDEGYIRPKRLLEVSLTNLPAFPGLPEIQTFSIKESNEVITDEKENASISIDEQLKILMERLDTMEAKLNPPTEEKEVIPEPKVETLEAVVPAAEPEPEKVEEKVEATVEPAVDEVKIELEAKQPELERVKVELERREKEEAIKLEADRLYSEKVRADKVKSLLETATKQGKIAPAAAKHYEAVAETNPEAFEAMLPYMKQVVPTGKMISGNHPKVDLGTLEDTPAREAAIYTKAFELQKHNPNLSLQEAVVLVRKQY